MMRFTRLAVALRPGVIRPRAVARAFSVLKQKPSVKPTPTALSTAALPADEQLINILMQIGHWKRDEGGLLWKTFEFRDDKTAERFVLRAKDTIKKLGFDVPVERVGKVVEFRVEFVAQAPPAEAEPGAASAAAAPPAAAPSPFANPAPGSVEVKVEASCFNRTVTQGEVDVAMAVDDVAAELQLGGRWN